MHNVGHTFNEFRLARWNPHHTSSVACEYTHPLITSSLNFGDRIKSDNLYMKHRTNIPILCYTVESKSNSNNIAFCIQKFYELGCSLTVTCKELLNGLVPHCVRTEKASLDNYKCTPNHHMHSTNLEEPPYCIPKM
jgi:hypothetical protein